MIDFESDIYIGETFENLKKGLGHLIKLNGDHYEGQFDDDKL